MHGILQIRNPQSNHADSGFHVRSSIMMHDDGSEDSVQLVPRSFITGFGKSVSNFHSVCRARPVVVPQATRPESGAVFTAGTPGYVQASRSARRLRENAHSARPPGITRPTQEIHMGTIMSSTRIRQSKTSRHRCAMTTIANNAPEII